MKHNAPPLSRRVRVSPLALAMVMAAGTAPMLPLAVQGQATGASSVAGVHRLTLEQGPNFIASPFHRTPTFRGTVQGVTATTVTVAGTPGWSPNQFGPRDGNSQYLLLLRKDLSATPGNAGDWWFVTANAAGTLTLDNDGVDLTTLLGPGDELELRRLTSLKDLFGSGPTLVLNKDSDGSADPLREDVIYQVTQTSFSSEIFYHDGSVAPAGYYVDGSGPYDGSTLTLGPDQPIMVYRKTGSPALRLLATGSVLGSPLTHYLAAGPNPVATGFPVDTPLIVSGLLESGWKADSNGSPSPAEEDILYSVSGTAFADEVFYHDGSLSAEGWYVNGSFNETYVLPPTAGSLAIVAPSGGRKWRQPPPGTEITNLP